MSLERYPLSQPGNLYGARFWGRLCDFERILPDEEPSSMLEAATTTHMRRPAFWKWHRLSCRGMATGDRQMSEGEELVAAIRRVYDINRLVSQSGVSPTARWMTTVLIIIQRRGWLVATSICGRSLLPWLQFHPVEIA